MRDGDQDLGDAKRLGDAFALAGEGDERLPVSVVEDLHIAPGDFAPPAGAEHFQDRLLGGKPPGQRGDGMLVTLHVPGF